MLNGALLSVDEYPAARDRYLPTREVLRRYGITETSLARWLADETLTFPRPTYFSRRRYWKLAEIIEWEGEQRRAHADAKQAQAQ